MEKVTHIYAKYNRGEISADEREQLRKLYDCYNYNWDTCDLYEKVAFEIKEQMQKQHEGEPFKDFESFENFYSEVICNCVNYINNLVYVGRMCQNYLNFWYFEILEKYFEMREEFEEYPEVTSVWELMVFVYRGIGWELDQATMYEQITGKKAGEE